MKTPDEVRSEYVRQWLEKADMDLKAAEYLLSASGFSDIICFHAQQAAEKFLKAVLAYKKVEIPKTHDLKLILNLTSLTEKELGLNEDEILELSGYCVEARYPADLPVLDAQDAMKAVDAVKKIHRAVLPLLTFDSGWTMKFKLEPDNRNVSDQELIEDLKRVAQILGKQTATIREYENYGRCHPSTLERRFGSWPLLSG